MKTNLFIRQHKFIHQLVFLIYVSLLFLFSVNIAEETMIISAVEPVPANDEIMQGQMHLPTVSIRTRACPMFFRRRLGVKLRFRVGRPARLARI
jgi:hypothetical protein